MPFMQMSALDKETDKATVDNQTTIPSTIETSNTFGRGLLRRLRFANEAEANNNASLEDKCCTSSLQRVSARSAVAIFQDGCKYEKEEISVVIWE